MNEPALKAQVKAAIYGLVVLIGADKAITFLREVQADILKDQRAPGDERHGHREFEQR